jgi:hypothetical protein
MALYPLQDFQALVASTKWCYLNERRAFRALDNLGWTDDDLAKLLCGINPSDFQKTVPNCAIQDFPGEDLVNADQYAVYWDEDTGTSCGDIYKATVSLSVKIAIMTTPDGQSAGVVTFHT